MLLTVIIISSVSIFGIIDTYFYCKAPWPERSKFYYMLPGGGIATYFLLKKRYVKELHKEK